MEKKKFGYCGLNYEDCPVFIATINNDNNQDKQPPKNGLSVMHSSLKKN